MGFEWGDAAPVEPQPALAGVLQVARAGTTLKTVMHAMHQSRTAPVALFDESSRFVGAIGISDVLKAVLRR